MQDNTQQPHPLETHPIHPGILNQTLGQILQSNPQAQQIVMRAMNIDQQQLQQMIGETNANPYMNTKISELFKSGFMQQAAGQFSQVKPEQLKQIVSQVGATHQQGEINGQPMQAIPIAFEQITTLPQTPAQQPIQVTTQPQKPGFLQKLKSLFR